MQPPKRLSQKSASLRDNRNVASPIISNHKESKSRGASSIRSGGKALSSGKKAQLSSTLPKIIQKSPKTRTDRSITPSRKSLNLNNDTTITTIKEVSVATKAKKKLKVLQNKKSNIRLARLEKVSRKYIIIDIYRCIKTYRNWSTRIELCNDYYIFIILFIQS